jgi:hypothetical protein
VVVEVVDLKIIVDQEVLVQVVLVVVELDQVLEVLQRLEELTLVVVEELVEVIILILKLEKLEVQVLLFLEDQAQLHLAQVQVRLQQFQHTLVVIN